MTDLNELLEKSGIIDFSYQKLRQEDRFNIFTILRNQDDEVNLHSRFLFELLNPKGSHNKQDEFLSLWLEIMETVNFSLEGVLVRKEYNNIDILITNSSKQAIIIENKIWAEDKDKQIERYFDDVTKLGFSVFRIFYLAPYEKDPSSQSVGKVSKDIIYTISYKYHISNWIKKCAGISAFNPNIRETLNQYQKLISDMTGNSNNRKEEEDYFQLMAIGDNAMKANKIVQNWIHVKWHSEWRFWHDLEVKITEKYKILDIDKFSPDTLTSAIHSSRNRNIHYGLTFCFATIEGFDFGIRLRRNGFGTNKLMYVLVIIEEGKIAKIIENTKFVEFGIILRHLSESNSDFNWLVKQTTDINFEDFNNKKTLELVNQESRMEIVTKLWSDIEQLIENIKKAMEDDKQAATLS